MGTDTETQSWPWRRQRRVSERRLSAGNENEMGDRRASRMLGAAGRILVALLVVGAVPSAALAQSEERDVERLRAELADETVTRLLRIIDDAAQDGVPKELLFRKALEGVSKGQSEAAIIQTVNEEARDLRAAIRAMGPDLGEEALGEAARALRRGVDPGVLRSLARGHPGSFSMLLLVVEDLVGQGVPAARAYQVVDEAVQQGYRGDRILALPTAMRQMVREGNSPGQAAATLQQRLRRNQPIIPPGIQPSG